MKPISAFILAGFLLLVSLTHIMARELRTAPRLKVPEQGGVNRPNTPIPPAGYAARETIEARCRREGGAYKPPECVGRNPQKQTQSGAGIGASLARSLPKLAFSLAEVGERSSSDKPTSPSESESLSSEDSLAKGLAIAREWYRREAGFRDSKVKLTMILENREGQRAIRKMRINTLEILNQDDGDKTLVIFDAPADIRGTALLSYAHILEPDDQWLFLPALKRVKRISSVNKSGPFVGSEFAYEDITGEELKKYVYRWLRDGQCGSLDCFVVERRPLYKYSGYTRLVTWYDKLEYRIQKTEYFDQKGDLMKTLTLGDYRKYSGAIRRAHLASMVNHQTGKKTQLVFQAFQFQTGLTANDFTKSALKRAH